MKRVLFIMLCICLPFAAGKSFAQRYLLGQRGLQLTVGGVDNFGSNVKHLGGNFQVGLALSRYNRNHSRWLFGADYVKKHYSYKEIAIPKAQFTGEVGYFVPFFSEPGQERVLLAVFPDWPVMRRPTGMTSCSMTGRHLRMTAASFTVLRRLSRWRRSFRTGWCFFSMFVRGYSSVHLWDISTR